MTEVASGYDRQELEKYYTPDWCVRSVIEVMKINAHSWIYDPAAGDGAILRAAWAMGLIAYGGDIVPDAAGIEAVDFLADKRDRRIVLTNPPYGAGGRLAVQFIKQALAVTEANRGKVAMLLRADFDSAPGRVDLFRDHPAFSMRCVLLQRVRWTNMPQVSGKGPSTNHTWFVWDWSKPSSVLPVTRYIA